MQLQESRSAHNLVLAALGNSYLAIEPALKENSLGKAMRNSFVLGCAAYATYIVPIYLISPPGLRFWYRSIFSSADA